jgi:hypothetical protein
MKKIFSFLSRCVLLLVPVAGAAGAEQEPIRAVSAEVWRFEIPGGVSAKSVFEQWRAQHPAGEPQLLALDGLLIPARDENTMVRIAGVLTAPVTGDYAFTIHAPGLHRFDRPDETELWIQDDRPGGWKLAQCTGNPNKSTGRTRFEAGVPRRFELWTMGRNQTAVDWEVADFGKIDPATGHATLKLARQMIPGIAIGLRTAAPDDPHGDGLLDSWKSRHGLEGDDGIGPNGPWGDPDGDGLSNWQEQLAGTAPLKADTEGRAGLVRWEVWRDIPGRYVFDLRRAGNFPTGPREVRFLDRLEIPTGNGDQYGSRVRGWLVAPADGEYRFGISADDGAELWLGENESWQSKRLIAQADQHVAGQLRWFRRNERGENVPLDSAQTGRVILKAGSRYYIEILHKQDNGPDHCAVSWIRPGAEKPERITKDHLVSWQPCPTDSEDDGLPDDWQRSAKLMDSSVDASMRHAEADPDGDGATNREEWRAGTDPLNRNNAPENGRRLTSEAWLDAPGHRVSDLASHPSYPAAPDFTTRVDNLDFGQQGENYGVRLRGYLTAPADGIYHFAIAGNNSGILYLGESEDKTTKRVIARAEHGTDWRFFSSDPRQHGGPFELKKDRSYYIEVLYKRGAADPSRRGDANDHSSVAWTRPGQKESVIPPEFFSPYLPDPRDFDDDDLPDEWENLHGLDPAVPGGKHGAWGDPDGDGLENFREFQLGLNPNITDVHGTPGLALWEYWDNREDLMPALRDDGGTLSERIRQDERFPLSPVLREWRDSLEAPRAVAINYASRMRAVITAPQTGEYVFAVSSHHASQLFLSSDASKFKRRPIASIAWASRYREWDNFESQVSASVRLEAGARYYIEALHAQGLNPLRRDHLCVAWKPPGSEKFEVIDSEHLTAFFRDPNDSDDDELPDDWENRYRLDATNPHGDHGPHGDPDRDGLTNMDEYQRGSDPRNGDSDGDGVTDHDEIHVYGSDPLVKDIIPPVKVANVDLALPRVSSGTWHSSLEGALISATRRGAVEFEVNLPTPGLYMLRVEAAAHSTAGHVPAVPLSVEIDGRRIGLMEVRRESAVQGWLTPTLHAGPHLIRLENRNVTLGVTLEILGVEILFHEGSAPGDKAAPAWLANYHAARNKVDKAPLSSPVSPLCIEGVARHPALVSIAAPDSTVAAAEGLTGRWFANVPLNATGPTNLTASFEQGAFTEPLEVEWSSTNLFTTAGPLLVRVGDSLKIVAIPAAAAGNETGAISLDGKTIHDGITAVPRIVAFEHPANHVITASVTTRAGSQTARLEVKAIDGAFGSPDAVAHGSSRIWSLSAIDKQLELEADPAVALTEVETPEKSPRRVQVALAANAPDANRIVARLPGGDGIVDAIAIPSFRVIDSAQALDAHVVNILPDGTRVVEIGIMIEGRIPSDLLLRIKLIVPDAVFANGESYYELRAGDFDENGVARLTIYKAPGQGVAAVCHTMEIEQIPEAEDEPSKE